MLNSKTNGFLMLGVYHIVLKWCGFGTRWKICLKKKAIILERGLGEECKKVLCRGNPTPGWFFTLYLVGGTFPFGSGAALRPFGACWGLDTIPRRASAPHGAVGTQRCSRIICSTPAHIYIPQVWETVCVTTQRLVFKTDGTGSTALPIQLRCTRRLPSLCAGKWAGKDFFRNCFWSRYIPAQAQCPNPLAWLDLCQLIRLLNRLYLGKKILTADHEKLGSVKRFWELAVKETWLNSISKSRWKSQKCLCHGGLLSWKVTGYFMLQKK